MLVDRIHDVAVTSARLSRELPEHLGLELRWRDPTGPGDRVATRAEASP
jgi:hypothetical protein